MKGGRDGWREGGRKGRKEERRKQGREGGGKEEGREDWRPQPYQVKLRRHWQFNDTKSRLFWLCPVM